MHAAQGTSAERYLCDGINDYARAIVRAEQDAMIDAMSSYSAWYSVASLGDEGFLHAEDAQYLEAVEYFEVLLANLKRIERDHVPDFTADQYLALLAVVAAHEDARYELAGRGPNAVSGESFLATYGNDLDALIQANRSGVAQCGNAWPHAINLDFIDQSDYRG